MGGPAGLAWHGVGGWLVSIIIATLLVFLLSPSMYNTCPPIYSIDPRDLVRLLPPLDRCKTVKKSCTNVSCPPCLIGRFLLRRYLPTYLAYPPTCFPA